MDRYLELHLHLDGAITPDIAKRLAALQGIALPYPDDGALLSALSVPQSCASLNDFLACFQLPLSLLQTPEALREAVVLVLENLRSQGVLYAELRFAPQLHTQRGMTQRQAVLAAVEGLRRSGLPGGLILCCMRGEDVRRANLETVELARELLTQTGGVVALDLAGAEALYPTSDYREEFALAARYQIPFTIHAGEAAGPASIRAAVELGARRIGHGVRWEGDEALLELLRRREITLELCPTSNRQTRAVEDMSRYPLQEYLRRGLLVTVNTDDMAISRTTLAEEFRYLERLTGLTRAQERRLLENALRGAFTSAEVRARLRKELPEMQ